MKYLDRYTPGQVRRQEVRPGITGYRLLIVVGIYQIILV